VKMISKEHDRCGDDHFPGVGQHRSRPQAGPIHDPRRDGAPREPLKGPLRRCGTTFNTQVTGSVHPAFQHPAHLGMLVSQPASGQRGLPSRDSRPAPEALRST
jgi:hypothetical protein